MTVLDFITASRETYFLIETFHQESGYVQCTVLHINRTRNKQLGEEHFVK